MSSGGPRGEMVSEGQFVCERERRVSGAGGQAMGAQLKVHTLAKI